MTGRSIKKAYDVRSRTRMGVLTVQIQASNGLEARAIAEAQYGRENGIDAVHTIRNPSLLQQRDR